MTPDAPYHPTDQHCPDCASEGYVELLHSNGTRTLCTHPYCGYDVTAATSTGPPPGEQIALIWPAKL